MLDQTSQNEDKEVGGSNFWLGLVIGIIIGSEFERIWGPGDLWGAVGGVFIVSIFGASLVIYVWVVDKFL